MAHDGAKVRKVRNIAVLKNMFFLRLQRPLPVLAENDEKLYIFWF